MLAVLPALAGLAVTAPTSSRGVAHRVLLRCARDGAFADRALSSAIEGAGGLWRITSAMVGAYETSIDCSQRRVVYNCAVPEPVNTCGEYDPSYAEDGEGAGSANADPLVITTINGTGGDDVMSG